MARVFRYWFICCCHALFPPRFRCFACAFSAPAHSHCGVWGYWGATVEAHADQQEKTACDSALSQCVQCEEHQAIWCAGSVGRSGSRAFFGAVCRLGASRRPSGATRRCRRAVVARFAYAGIGARFATPHGAKAIGIWQHQRGIWQQARILGQRGHARAAAYTEGLPSRGCRTYRASLGPHAGGEGSTVLQRQHFAHFGHICARPSRINAARAAVARHGCIDACR